MSAAFAGSIVFSNVNEWLLASWHSTVKTSSTSRCSSRPSASSSSTRSSGVTVVPGDAVASVVSRTSIGADGPWLVITLRSVISVGSPTRISAGGSTASKLTISRSATATTSVSSVTVLSAGSGSIVTPATVAVFVIVVGPPASKTRSAAISTTISISST